MNVAEIGLLTYGMNAIWLLIALTVLVVLLRLYAQTRMSGFLWLLFAVVVWPFFARGTSLLLPVYLARQMQPANSMVLFTVGWAAVETIVGGVLLLIAVLVLLKETSSRMAVPQPLAPAPPVAGLGPYPR